MSGNQWVDFVRTRLFRREYAHIIAQVVAFIILLAAAALLTSCGDSPNATSTPAPATVAPTAMPTIAPTVTPAITIPSATAGTEPTASQTDGTDSMDIPEELKAPYAAAVVDITKRDQQVSASSLKLTDYSSEQFPDSALGCPKANTMYTQVITAGYILNIQAGDKTYSYHTNRTGTRIVLCTPSSPILPANP